MSTCGPKPCGYCDSGRGHPNPLPMDEVDAAQEDRLNANDQTDAAQQKSIDKLEKSQFWMMLMLAINTLASLAQIWEATTVWFRLK